MEDVTIYFFPITLLTLLLISGGISVWKYFEKSKSESKCPNCNSFWATEIISKKLVGVFKKADEWPRHIKALINKEDAVKMIQYEKYEIQVKCKYCGHLWIFFKSIKQ